MISIFKDSNNLNIGGKLFASVRNVKSSEISTAKQLVFEQNDLEFEFEDDALVKFLPNKADSKEGEILCDCQ